MQMHVLIVFIEKTKKKRYVAKRNLPPAIPNFLYRFEEPS